MKESAGCGQPIPQFGTTVGKRRRIQQAKRGFLNLPKGYIFEVATCMWEALDTPVSLGLYLRAKYGLWEEISKIRIEPLNYMRAKDFFLDSCAINFLRKHRELPITTDRKSAAREKFLAAEITCSETNLRIREWLGGRLSPRRPAVNVVLYNARWKIRNLLGAVNLDEISRLMRWGPGASSATRGAFVSAYHKFDAAPECTLSALNLAKAAVNSCPTWAMAIAGTELPCSVLSTAFQVIPGNRLTYVPKDATIDRVIAIEPHMNIYMQLGVGGVIRRKLKKVGIDLDDQSRNQEYAKRAFLEGFATVDLSSASDTISRELVEFLLPREWWALLEQLRSVNGKDEGPTSEFKRYTKFSSMGNGYTFELESLLFWALSSATLELCHQVPYDKGTPEHTIAMREYVRENLCVYGDDIIIPSSAYDLLTEVFSFAGFVINGSKSYRHGSFFESCGKHYFQGLDVTPVYFDSTPTLITEYFGLINQITALAGRFGHPVYPAKFLLPVREKLISLIPKRDRIFGPLYYGDGFIHGSFDECKPFTEVQRNWVEGYLFLQFVPRPKKIDVVSRAALPWGLYELERQVRIRKDFGPLNFAKTPLASAADPPYNNGQVGLRGVPVRFKLARLGVPRPTFVGYWH
jgi:hypothetical protein